MKDKCTLNPLLKYEIKKQDIDNFKKTCGHPLKKYALMTRYPYNYKKITLDSLK